MTGLRLHLRVFRRGGFVLPNKTSGFQCKICASLFHRLETFCGNTYGDFLAEFGDEKSLRLEIDLAAALAGRVEFGRTRAVRIPPADLRCFASDVTYSCHTFIFPRPGMPAP